MAVVSAAAAVSRTVAGVAAVAAVLGERDRVVLGKAPQQRALVRIVVAGRRLRERVRHRILMTGEPCREQARYEEAGALHNGWTAKAACSSGCHSKNPEQALRSPQRRQAGANLRFQSEIEAIARRR